MLCDGRYALARFACTTALVMAMASTAFAQTDPPPDPPPDVETEAGEEAQPVAPFEIFTNITDAAPGVCYDAASSKPSETDPNQLLIGMHSGLDPVTWMNTGCIASTAGFHVRQMMDTIALRVNAPDGFYVSGLRFEQDGTSTASRLAQVFAGAQWVVEGYPAQAGLRGASADLSGMCKTSVSFSFSIFLGAKIVGTPGNAVASVSNPVLTAKFSPLTDCQ